MLRYNLDVTIYERTQDADDVYGGAQARYTVARGSARARIQSREATISMRAQGLGTDRLYDALISPASIIANTGDLLAVDDNLQQGTFAGMTFLVQGVHRSPHLETQNPEATLKLQLERWDDGKALLEVT